MTTLEIISHEPATRQHETPLLFVHGAWHAAWCWKTHFLPYFAEKGWSVHALSLRGHGRSPSSKSLRFCSLADYVADVTAVAQQLNTSPIVIGHSMGGMVVQKYLETYHAPAAILLASVPPHGVWRTSLHMLRHYPLEFLTVNVRLSLYPLVKTPTLARENLFSEDLAEETVQTYYGRLQDESYRAFIDMLLLSLPRPQLVKAPLLVLGGERDSIFPPAEVRATARAYHTQAHLLPVAHDIMLEANWQLAADKMLDWLSEQGF